MVRRRKCKMQIVREGLISCYSFIAGLMVPAILSILLSKTSLVVQTQLFASVVFSYLLVNVVFCIIFGRVLMKIVLRASFLGCVFYSGVYLSLIGESNWCVFGWYVCVLSFFHYSEYLSIAITNPKALTIDAFMLNHSVAYGAAAAASWIEFFVENHFYPELKTYHYISVGGLCLCVLGEIIRKSAMFTASTNFNHIVQTVKEPDHVLVTRGIYKVCRHPSYAGWFYWSIGTQLILVNPACIVIYALASWTFFKKRLLVEEYALVSFFGQEYVDYKRKVHSGLPFNDGIVLENQ